MPENAIKFVVGAMIVSFGTFWTLEALAGDVWPFGDWSLLVLAVFFLAGGQAMVPLIRQARVVSGMKAFVKTLFGDARKSLESP